MNKGENAMEFQYKGLKAALERVESRFAAMALLDMMSGQGLL